MSEKNLQIHIGAENKRQANAILSALLKKKLVAGGSILLAPSSFWWKGKIVSVNHYIILAYTIAKHKKSIILEVERVSVEDVPGIIFATIDGNKKFADWISTSLK